MEPNEGEVRKKKRILVFDSFFQNATRGILGTGERRSHRTNESPQSTVNENSSSEISQRVVKIIPNQSTETPLSIENRSQRTKQYNDKPSERLNFYKSKNSNITNSSNESFSKLKNDHHNRKDGSKRNDPETSVASPEDEFVHTIDLDKKHNRKIKCSKITFNNDFYLNAENESLGKNLPPSSEKQLSQVTEDKPVRENKQSTLSYSNELSEQKSISSEKNASNTYDLGKIPANSSFNCQNSTGETSKIKPVSNTSGILHTGNNSFHRLDDSYEAVEDKYKFTNQNLEKEISNTKPVSCTSNELSEQKSISSEKNASNTYDLRKIPENSSFNCQYSTGERSKIKPVSNTSGILHTGNNLFHRLDDSYEAVEDKYKFTNQNFKKEISNTKPVSCTSCFSFPQEISYPSHDYNSKLAHSKNKELLLSSATDYIPPPVSPEVLNISGAANLERSDAQRQLECNSDTSPSEDDTCTSLPDSEHLNAISDFIKKITTERKCCPSSIDDVVRDLNGLFKDHFEGNLIDIYGSYATDLAITTSNINLVIKTDISIKKSFMIEVYRFLANELEKYRVHPLEEGSYAHDTKINFSDPKTGINCELAYLGRKRGENIAKMEKYLKTVCDFDPHFQTLIIAAKIWAEYLSINEVEDGKLHSISFALMVIHFLQHCENPLLPISGSVEVPPFRDVSIGELWMTFLRYYAVTFNWKRDVVTVDTKDIVTKKSKEWENYWIAIEDPFSGKNVAASVVNCDIADYITACFKSSYEYFCNPLQTDCSFNEDNEVPSSPKLEFNFQNCVMGQDDAYCETCEELNDTCCECQKKLYVQPITPMPKMTDEFLQMIKKALCTVYEEYMLSDEEVLERKQFVNSLESTIHRIHPDAKLNLFGSSSNGFGFKKSDLDICISFQANKVINSVAVLKDIRSLLRRDKRFDRIIAIFNATIPIIKFHFQPKGWRGDISLNNTLAVHNSELLYTYSLTDERCKILGCALKLLAKKALVAEVTEKALSSYSYLIMVIHFLQQTEPPVLPILQDNQYRKTDYNLEYIVENCNIWFCKDLEYIKSVFKSENDTPVEQLWLDLLDYYCSLDSNKFITIRQKEMLQVNENYRCARLFNIQDPFIETKNLGVVVSVKKADETKSVFNRARHLFRTPRKEFPSGVKDIEDYFFSSMSLTGRIQKEAFCEMCGKFGHEKKDCKQCYFLPPKFGRFRYNNALRKGNFKNRYQQRPTNRTAKPQANNEQYPINRKQKSWGSNEHHPMPRTQRLWVSNEQHLPTRVTKPWTSSQQHPQTKLIPQ